MITYQEELIKDLQAELTPILMDHWHELANHKDTRPADVDWDQYIKTNEAGLVRIFVARDEDKLVGYASYLISYNMHYKTWLYACNDVYYVRPEYRKTGFALEFFQHIEIWLKSLGVKSITIFDKINHSHEKFFLNQGYNKIEQVYEKVI